MSFLDDLGNAAEGLVGGAANAACGLVDDAGGSPVPRRRCLGMLRASPSADRPVDELGSNVQQPYRRRGRRAAPDFRRTDERKLTRPTTSLAHRRPTASRRRLPGWRRTT